MSENIPEPTHTWTFQSLREYLLRVVSDLAERQSQLAVAQERAVQAALIAQEKAVQAALAAADKAVLKAEEGAQLWRQQSNEWRGAMDDRERSFIPRTEFALAISTLNEKVERLEKNSTISSSIKQGGAEAIAYVIAIGGIAIGAGGLLLAVLK